MDITQIHHNGQDYTDINTIVEQFNKYFSHVGKNQAENIGARVKYKCKIKT